MYCKYCGKEIADDSRFCKYCGKVVEEVEGEIVETPTETSKEDVVEPQKVEAVLSTNDDQPVQVEISRKAIIKKSTFANEVVANVKMIGLAVLLWAVYILGFSLYRVVAGDLSQTSFYGQSCYDSPMSGHWELEWEKHYVKAMDELYGMEMYDGNELSYIINYKRRDFSMFDRSACKREGDAIAEKLRLTFWRIEEIQDEAKAAAEREKERFYEEVYERRLWGFEDEIVEHMKWAAIISIFLTIVGRYGIKFFKWVSENMDAAK